MQEVFEKIIEEIDNRIKTQIKIMDRLANETCREICRYGFGKSLEAYEQSKLIVEQAAASCSNGWIPCSERLPEELKKYKDLDLEKQGLLRLPCKVGDTVWEICKCNDCEYRIFPMEVVDVIPYGGVRRIKGEEPTTWNIYAISDYTDVYKSFYDFGKTVFLTKEEAEEALGKMKKSEG